MFYLHASNKTENLLEHLLAVMQAAPLASPFSQEVFLIQSQGMERWLSQQLASRMRVWANDQFLFPGKFFNSIAERLDSRLSDVSLDRNLMLWRFEALLRDVEDPVYAPLRQYLQEGNLALKRFQLAQQLAKVFDQYQIMRPDLLNLWQQGGLMFPGNSAELWQRALWLAISKSRGLQHRGSLWLDVIKRLHEHLPGHFSAQLPERISIFGVNILPPLFLDFLYALAQHCDLHFYLLNPVEGFWADLESKRQRVKQLAQEESDAEATSFNGHPLLASLGQQGREFQDMLLAQTYFNLELQSFEANQGNTILERLQNDILLNALEAEPKAMPLDNSISVHACHSRMREVEVLKNLLLDALEKDPQLALRDIVVMAPDIQVYEPFITAVFSDIQYAIADRSLRISNTALDAFIRFLKLCQSRFGWQSVLDLLEQRVVYPSFDLNEDELDLVKHWIQATQIRWGQSAAHKQSFGLPASAQNTWQQALERLLMGYAVGVDDAFVADVLPFIEIEGGNTQALGGFYDFLHLLFTASQSFAQSYSAQQWYAQLANYADTLLATAEPVERQQLQVLLAELLEKIALIHNQPIALSVIIQWLESRVSEQISGNGFLRGQLTFCSMLPMRSIPFKVIALLGMNDGEFPKIDRQASFDLLALRFRKGDRSSRADDRYQFLEILLSSRQQLMMTYIGQSMAQNERIPPSVVVSELLEVLQHDYGLSALTHYHPLQAFSSSYFKAGTALGSYASSECETAIALQAAKPDIAPWWQGYALAADEPVLEIADIMRFFSHPQRYFLQRHLDVRFTGLQAEAEEREPFSVENLAAYVLQQDWINALLRGEEIALPILQAKGLWLTGSAAELEFQRWHEALTDFVARIQAKNLGAALPDLPLDIECAGLRLLGIIGQQYAGAGLRFRYADLKGRDFILAWLQHLLVNQRMPQSTYLLSKDYDFTFLPEHCLGHSLADWLALYQAGLLRPDAFFTETAFAYVQQALKLQQSTKVSKPALLEAQEHLSACLTKGYEAELQLLYPEPALLAAALDEQFERYCQTLLLPVWQALADG